MTDIIFIAERGIDGRSGLVGAGIGIAIWIVISVVRSFGKDKNK